MNTAITPALDGHLMRLNMGGEMPHNKQGSEARLSYGKTELGLVGPANSTYPRRRNRTKHAAVLVPTIHTALKVTNLRLAGLGVETKHATNYKRQPCPVAGDDSKSGARKESAGGRKKHGKRSSNTSRRLQPQGRKQKNSKQTKQNK